MPLCLDKVGEGAVCHAHAWCAGQERSTLRLSGGASVVGPAEYSGRLPFAAIRRLTLSDPLAAPPDMR